MDSILQEFSILPGVLGSCIMTRKKGIIFSNFPAFFSASMIDEAVNTLNKMMQMARVKNLEPQTLSIQFDKFDIIVMPVDSRAVLLVLCESGNNTALVTTTALLLKPELEKVLDQSSPPPANEFPADNTQKAPASNSIDPKTTQALHTIKETLFNSLGPIADMIYSESVKRWTANGAPDASRIKELINYISEDINNPSIFEEFKEKITALL